MDSIATVTKEMPVTDRPSFPDTNRNDGGVDPGSPIGTPRWVKVSALIALAVLVVFVILLLAGGHNPDSGRH